MELDESLHIYAGNNIVLHKLTFYRSAEDANVFIVNDFQSRLQVTITNHLMLCGVIILVYLMG